MMRVGERDLAAAISSLCPAERMADILGWRVPNGYSVAFVISGAAEPEANS